MDRKPSCLILENPQSASLAVPVAVNRMLGDLTARQRWDGGVACQGWGGSSSAMSVMRL